MSVKIIADSTCYLPKEYTDKYKVSIASCHLWDGDKDEYNTDYVKRLVPGTPCVLINLAYRLQGFYVEKGK